MVYRLWFMMFGLGLSTCSKPSALSSRAGPGNASHETPPEPLPDHLYYVWNKVCTALRDPPLCGGSLKVRTRLKKSEIPVEYLTL